MSNKKGFPTKPSVPEVLNTVPPRYQPPPQPPGNSGVPQNPSSNPGILKNPQAIIKDVKNFPGPQKEVKNYPTDPKFYPVSNQQSVQRFPSYPYPPGPNRAIAQEGVQIPQRPFEQSRIDPRVAENRIDQQINGLPITRRFSEEEFRQQSQEMLKFVRKPEDNRVPIGLPPNDPRHIQNMMGELRILKDANQRLADDNQELRDLCCFLDDDRQKGRKLAREWQRFGRYTASVMRQEVSAYQSKLRELENKQQELIKDNLELKELCLYLDEERSGGSVCPSCGTTTRENLRDDGDGSSSSTNADEPGLNQNFNAPRRSASRERLLNDSLARQRNTFNDQTMQYVRTLEQRCKQLEDDKRALQLKLSQVSPDCAPPTETIEPPLSGRPEAVVRALQVLEVREQLEGERRTHIQIEEPQNMDDGEKALVREMCNVVWRKLEEAPQARR